jgi:hypothetical protein
MENSATSDIFFIREKESNSSLVSSVDNGTDDVVADSPTNLTYATPFIGRAKYNGSTLLTAFNGSFGSSSSITGTINIDEIFLSYTANQMNGQFGETVIIPSSDEDLGQKIESYLAWKWGLVSDLPSDHPYKTSTPKA